MGIIRLPSYRDHFYICILGSKINEITYLKKCERIKSFIHLADNLKNDGTPLYKLGPFIWINSLLKKYYYPKKFLCLDEYIISFYGKHNFTTYNKLKQSKSGNKAYTFCELNTYYSLDYKIYTKKKFTNFYEDIYKELRLNFKTALTLYMMIYYADCNHTLIIDIYYTSIMLI